MANLATYIVGYRNVRRSQRTCRNDLRQSVEGTRRHIDAMAIATTRSDAAMAERAIAKVRPVGRI
jgi:hypothetical protein